MLYTLLVFETPLNIFFEFVIIIQLSLPFVMPQNWGDFLYNFWPLVFGPGRQQILATPLDTAILAVL
jgi:hypothetical protein